MTPPLIITGRGINMKLRMGSGPAAPTGGIGGYEEVTRPRDTPILDPSGQPLRRQTVPVMLNGWSENNSVQRLLNRIEDLGKGEPPPNFKLHGPVHDTNLRWVLEDISYDDGAIRNTNGILVRQPLTLAFCEYVRPDQIRIRGRKKKAGGPRVDDAFPYKTKAGETLHRVAAQRLGNANLWKQIAGAGTNDPDKSIKPATTLRLK